MPNGFQVSLEKTPAEGEDLRLSCTANRFLYGNLTWLLLRTAGNRTVQHSISKQRQAASTALSATLDLVIRNVSLEASGTYACRARNLFTGEEILQKKEVAIRGEHCDKKAVFSRMSKFKSARSDCATQSNVKH